MKGGFRFALLVPITIVLFCLIGLLNLCMFLKVPFPSSAGLSLLYSSIVLIPKVVSEFSLGFESLQRAFVSRSQLAVSLDVAAHPVSV